MQYVLVHGSWHGSWCWKKLTPFLEQEGHHVNCVDLPGYDTTGSHSAVRYQDYYKHLENVLLQSNEPVVLVAHSMSGIVAAPLADRLPNYVHHTFFISAFLPNFGESLMDIAQRYNTSKIPSILEVDSVNKRHHLNLKGAGDVLYHDCDKEIKTWAIKQLRPQPYEPLETPSDWQDSLLHHEKRTYILCQKDQDVVLQTQKDMLKEHPCHTVSMDCGHFPFLSHPEELANILLSPAPLQ